MDSNNINTSESVLIFDQFKLSAFFLRCNERQIDDQKFEPDSINHSYPFDDHNPPRFSQMVECCMHINKYLEQDDNNIVAVQCKAGKGRTGVIVCSYLLLDGCNKNATDALHYYGRARTTNGKGVTIPSQIRYIYYYDHLLHNHLTYADTELKFDHLVLEELPNIAGNGYEIQIVVSRYEQEEKIREYHCSQFYEVKKDNQRSLKLYGDDDWVLRGDLKFQVVLKSKFGKKENLCHCWINTFFVVNKPSVMFLDDKASTNKLDVHFNTTRKTQRNNPDQSERPKPASRDNVTCVNNERAYKLTLQKQEIDKANKDTNCKIFPPNFAVSFFFEDPSAPIPKNDNGLLLPTELNTDPHRFRNNSSRHHRAVVESDRRGPSPVMSSKEEISDTCDDRSESSESSTKQSPSDIDEPSS